MVTLCFPSLFKKGAQTENKNDESSKQVKKSGGVVAFQDCDEFDGDIIPKGFNYSSAIQYQAQPGDVFLCTFPKSGTTWAGNILYLLESSGEPLTENRMLQDYVPYLDLLGKDYIEKLSPPRKMKSHMRYQRIPKSQDSKYIYIARNPKDCCVSFYYHSRGFKNAYTFEGNFDEFFELFMEGKNLFGDYFEHILSWSKHLNDENVLFLTYEDMVHDTHESIRKIAKFLGPKYEEKVQNQEILEKIVFHSDIKNMKKQDHQKWLGVHKSPTQKEEEDSKEKQRTYRPSNMPFIRKGEIGDWTNHFSEEQSKRLNEKFRNKTKGTVFEHLWEGIM